MKEFLKIFSVLFLISSLAFGSISVFAENTSVPDTINNTNDTNNTNEIVTDNAVIQPMSISVSLTVTPTTINLGNLAADGQEHIYTGATTARVEAIGLSGYLYVRATGDFTRGTDTSRTISLNNFKYDCPEVSVGKTQFMTTDQTIHRYTYFLGYDHTYDMNYYLTIPTGTDPGTYNTTIIYTAT
jgi:hypothetical protein